MATQRLSQITLEGWQDSPVTRFSPLPAPVTFTPADVLVLTQAGSTFNGAPSFNGRLPTAAEIGGAPYYAMHIRVAGTEVDSTDCLLVEIDGVQSSLALRPQAPLVLSTTSVQNSTYLLIPPTAQEVTITALALTNAVAVLLDYSYSIPTAPQNRVLNEPLSVDELEIYTLCPLTPVRPANYADLTVTAGAGRVAAILPTEADLNGAPFYYLSARLLETPTGLNQILAALYFNQSPIPSEWLYPDPASPAQMNYLPYPERISPVASAFLGVDPEYTRLSPDGITSIEFEVLGGVGLADLTVQYTYLVPTWPLQ